MNKDVRDVNKSSGIPYTPKGKTHTHTHTHTQQAQRATWRAPEYNVPPFWRICKGGHFLLISAKNINMVGDIQILLLVKFHWIPFRSFRGEVENVSAHQRPERPFCFSDRAEKHKLGGGRWDLASYQILVEIRSAVSEEKSTMSKLIIGQSGHLVFPIDPKNTNLVEDLEILLPVKFYWIPFSSYRSQNVSVNHRPERPSCFFRLTRKKQFGRGRWGLASCQVSLILFRSFRGEVDYVKS